MANLREYGRRRDFQRTPEPPPRERKAASGPLRFVVQAHAAKTLHYDFRLQVGDVLVSWAVPKGPSLNPKDRRLAVLTEDHPLDYARFEGTIPQGEYGGGSVIVWDEGTWEPEGKPREGLKKGKLSFNLHGKKLHGRFHLTRMRDRSRAAKKSNEAGDGSTWLLIKSRDAEAREGADVVGQAPESVVSGRTLAEITKAPAKVWSGAARAGLVRGGAQRASFPTERTPQLATLVSEAPAGDGFLHEAKLDGYRLLAEVRKGPAGKNRVKLWTRGNQEWSDRFPTLTAYLASLQLGEVLLDGEVVAWDEQGRSNFQLLQNAPGSKKEGELTFVVFDLLHQDGYDLANVPLLERKNALAALLQTAAADPRTLRFSDHVLGNGPEFFAEACKLGLEGIVSKKVNASYRGGRSQAWLKCKCLKRQEVVIGGYTEPSGSRSGLGAILVGLHDGAGNLRYSGKVGTGFTERSLKDLHARLSKLGRKTSPFDDPPRGAAVRGVHWVRPELLAEVAYSEITSGGKLRHPSFQGLREDKRGEQVELERPARLLSLTHPERVLYPEPGPNGPGLTKQELAEYYQRVAERILPHVAGRLLTLVRCPAGQGKPCFYQKHAKEGLPEAIHTHPVKADEEPYVYVRDARGLVGLVQVGVLELHSWGSTVEDLEHPDRLVFDLDPDPELDWARLVEGALDVRDALREVGLESFVKTTGGKGLHVTVPLSARSDWAQAKAFAKGIADQLARRKPSRYVATMSKEKRSGKIFLDYLRNARGATAVAPYSTRATTGAPIATPIAWNELGQDVREAFPLRSVLERLATLQADPWAGFFDLNQTIAP